MTKKDIIFFLSIFFLSILLSTRTFAQQSYPFIPHEDMKFSAYYNLGPIWVHAGNVELTADTLTYNGLKCVHFIATGYSLKKYAFIFKLEDHYQSITTLNGFKPLYYEKKTLEGGFYIHNIYHFHWDKHLIDVHTEATRHPVKDTVFSLDSPLYDVLSATYYLRIIDLNSLTVGDTIPVPLIIDGKKTTYHIVYKGKGEMVYKKKHIKCDVYAAVMANSTFFSEKDPLKVFVTSGKHHYPIYLEANIIVGSLKVFMLPYLNYRPKFKSHKRR